ncbi:VanW family protein [Candidatus Formimonas warabiya]|uniref:G5 domain-containing protein n=1 Tax=Formimonas warabiya TaxID=1761012 RepID=A0A3G1KRQ0_FORW1|nr:VanW family protein [Candidatus Formimonas warabiya]ATW25137.1 hypothetical protein DCMF_10480 [Candidatus Formimonas warabiya]
MKITRLYQAVSLCTLLCLTGTLVAGCQSPQKKPAPSPQRTGQVEEKGGSKEAGMLWDEDPAFIKACQENGTFIRMASYSAVLPDPILHERDNISLGAKYLAGAVVKPAAVFSLNDRISRRSAARGFLPGPMYRDGHIVSTMGGGVCKIASVIYNVAVLANQQIIERYPHSMTVPYVPPGQDATISYGTKDFKFKNVSGAPILVWAQNRGGTLYMAFYGTSRPPQVKWIHQVLDKTPFWTEYQNDPSLPKGSEKEIFSGSQGITVHSWVEVTTKTQKIKKDMGISAYQPAPRVVARNK